MSISKTAFPEIYRYSQEEVWLPFSENILEWEENFYCLLLNDSIRMNAYQKAINEVVKPGTVVLDLGTGTGILGLWALQAGAKFLYAIEVNPDLIPQANRTFEQSNFYGKYKIFNDISYQVSLPEKVDIIISEIIGNLGDNEDFVPILNDAQKRFLKPEGKMLPSKVKTRLVPVSSLKAHNQIRLKGCKGINQGYNLEVLLKKLSLENPFNLYYDVILPQTCYLSKPQVARKFNMDGTDCPVYTTELNFTVEKDGIFTGFKGSFVASLSDLVKLDISGGDIVSRTTSDSWKHCYLPVEIPADVRCGDEINLSYSRSYPHRRDSLFRQYYHWSGNIKRYGQIIHSFFQSMEENSLS